MWVSRMAKGTDDRERPLANWAQMLAVLIASILAAASVGELAIDRHANLPAHDWALKNALVVSEKLSKVQTDVAALLKGVERLEKRKDVGGE